MCPGAHIDGSFGQVGGVSKDHPATATNSTTWRCGSFGLNGAVVGNGFTGQTDGSTRSTPPTIGCSARYISTIGGEDTTRGNGKRTISIGFEGKCSTTGTPASSSSRTPARTTMQVSNVGRAVGIAKGCVRGMILPDGSISTPATYGAVYTELSTSWTIAITVVLGTTIVATEPAHAIIDRGTVEPRVGRFGTSTIDREGGTNGNITVVGGFKDKRIFSL